MTSRIGNEASLLDNVPKLGIGGALSKREPLKYLCNHLIYAQCFHFLSPPTAHCETNEEDKKEINIFYYYHVLLIYSKTFHTNIQFNVIFFIYDTSLF